MYIYIYYTICVYQVIQSEHFLCPSWRSPTIFDFGSLKTLPLPIPKRSLFRGNCQVYTHISYRPPSKFLSQMTELTCAGMFHNFTRVFSQGDHISIYIYVFQVCQPTLPPPSIGMCQDSSPPPLLLIRRPCWYGNSAETSRFADLVHFFKRIFRII